MNDGFNKKRNETDRICINTIRTLSMDAVQKARSGHPGAPMGLAPAAHVLWTRILKHNPKNPSWINRDRFVLSGGHASMLLYSLLHLTGYDMSLDDLENFRQWGSKTPGHPEYGHTPGVETTTGPLGQGFANAIGMAMAERHLAAAFNRPGHEIIDHHTFVICGDGDMMEGVSAEAASLAGHLGLGKLVVIYDDNGISIEGSTKITFTEDVSLRFEAYHWHIEQVDDGNDLEAIEKALRVAQAESGRPSLIVLRTHIAFGSPNKQDSASAHGEPLGEEEVVLTKKNLGCPESECFYVPDQTLRCCDDCVTRGQAFEEAWRQKFSAYQAVYPELAVRLLDAVCGRLPDGWDLDLPIFAGGPISTRAASGQALNKIAEKIPQLIGGSADLAPSNNTLIKTSHDFQKNSYDGRNIRFGVREHAMAAIVSGMALHKGLRPYCGTFLVFADYMRPAIRLAAIMKLPVIYVFTHDSIAVGEDGPTHQPVEQIASLRAIPGLTVIRPADATETVHAWRLAVSIADGPVALILTRQAVPLLTADAPCARDGIQKGAYILADSERPDIILIGTGSEVHLAMEAKAHLEQEGISVRVVNMPSWELFEKAPEAYKDAVLPQQATARLAVEAGISMGWERYVGAGGKVIGMTGFGSSAPGGVLLEKFGFTAAAVAEKARSLLRR